METIFTPTRTRRLIDFQPATEEDRAALLRAFRESASVGKMDGIPAYVTRIDRRLDDDGNMIENFTIEVKYPVPPDTSPF